MRATCNRGVHVAVIVRRVRAVPCRNRPPAAADWHRPGRDLVRATCDRGGHVAVIVRRFQGEQLRAREL
ncbi:hypothetical protein ACOQFV_29705 [Nocardiopsis changdeensis]|uniref:Uncharacterized protein n=1 Tax=Nocardiopsis changdeensis TaxID=2831969 RepID=A0ABX8BSL7_9ACTN|nr:MULTISPECIES: hypothetical protein [Nocardiopsis]QUX25002.1 hypothetical protein KGD84_12495 [Nocardiopsis changdeensis]QYX35389.1 hypothetical protein K1J57_21945 [Nocardiopsis sp. MT53]